VKRGLNLILALLFSFLWVTVSASQNLSDANNPPDFKSLEVQDLKKDVLKLNRELFILEEELLFPTNTQVAIFLSLGSEAYFALDSVQVKIDDKVVSNYLYTKREVDALHRGGIHRVYFGNIRAGEHELVAFFTGKGPQGRDYRRAATLVFEKKIGQKYIELQILDLENKQQPEFTIKEWE